MYMKSIPNPHATNILLPMNVLQRADHVFMSCMRLLDVTVHLEDEPQELSILNLHECSEFHSLFVEVMILFGLHTCAGTATITELMHVNWDRIEACECSLHDFSMRQLD